MTMIALQKLKIKQTNKNLTGNVLFLQLHLVLQVCQQYFTPLVYSEADRVEIIAGGL